MSGGSCVNITDIAHSMGVTEEAVRRAADTCALFKDLCRFVPPEDGELMARVDGHNVRITCEEPPRIFIYDLLCAVTTRSLKHANGTFGGLLSSPEVLFFE